MGSEMPMGETVKVILAIIGFFFVIAILFMFYSLVFPTTTNLAKNEANMIASRMEKVLEEKGDYTKLSLAQDNLETVHLIVKGEPYMVFGKSKKGVPYDIAIAEKTQLCVLTQEEESFYYCENLDFHVFKKGKVSSKPCVEGSQYVVIGNKKDIGKVELTLVPDFAIDFSTWVTKLISPGGEEALEDTFYFVEKRSEMFLSEDFKERVNATTDKKSVEFFVDASGRILLFGPINRPVI